MCIHSAYLPIFKLFMKHLQTHRETARTTSAHRFPYTPFMCLCINVEICTTVTHEFMHPTRAIALKVIILSVCIHVDVVPIHAISFSSSLVIVSLVSKRCVSLLLCVGVWAFAAHIFGNLIADGFSAISKLFSRSSSVLLNWVLTAAAAHIQHTNLKQQTATRPTISET